MHNLALIFARDIGQNRISHRLESARNQGRANGLRRLTAAQCNHASPPTHRHGRLRQKVTRQIDNVFDVIRLPDGIDNIVADDIAVSLGNQFGTANAGIVAEIFGQRGGDNAIGQISFHQSGGVVVFIAQPGLAPDIISGSYSLKQTFN